MMKLFQHSDGTVVKHPDGAGLEPPDWTYVGDVPQGAKPELTTYANGGSVIDLTPVWSGLRRARDLRLQACDWTQLPDVPEETRLLWQPYRQALRDLPEATADPLCPEWPVPPS